MRGVVVADRVVILVGHEQLVLQMQWYVHHRRGGGGDRHEVQRYKSAEASQRGDVRVVGRAVESWRVRERRAAPSQRGGVCR